MLYQYQLLTILNAARLPKDNGFILFVNSNFFNLHNLMEYNSLSSQLKLFKKNSGFYLHYTRMVLYYT